ncbi:MAG: PAS domain S-box protein [Chloroflexi bacterium]|nr:PAS domain S-box protein [Chloroflexota bacterium]
MSLSPTTLEPIAQDRQQVEKTRLASEEQYHALADAMPHMVWTARPDGELDYYNQRWFDYTGTTLVETLGQGWAMLMHPADLQKWTDLWTKSITTGRSLESEYRFKRAADSVYRWHLARAAPIRNSDGQITRWIGTCTDIEDLKREAEAFAARAAIVEASDDAIIGEDMNGVIVTWNGGARRLYGYTAEEAIGRSASFLIPWDLPEELTQILAKIRLGQTIEHHETVRVRKDGKRLDVSFTLSPMRDGQGHITGIAGIARDITEARRSEAELRRSNEELEQFAYVASHDLQEPLRAMAGTVQILKRRYVGQLDERADEIITHAVAAVGRMQTLVSDLLALSRLARHGNPFAPTDFAAVLQDVSANLEVTIAESSATITHDPLPEIVADASQLRQLLQNLFSNSIKFRAERPLKLHVGACRRENTWLFSVSDNGLGIEPQYFERIFIIFQRLHTRDEYPGTGIGLAICKKIVERHGGEIWLESEAGEGTTFYFTIADPATGTGVDLTEAP